MDRPASYAPPTQQGLASVSSIQNILAYSRPSPQLPPQDLGPPAVALSAEVPFSQDTFIDGRQRTATSEPDLINDDCAQPSGDSGARRRSINSSKRAAQNRAAQRAFRLRRERYVAGLEEKARNFDRLEAAYLDIQRENFQLRSRLHKLQSENTAMRAHLGAASAPVSPSPVGTMPTSFSPAAAMSSAAHPLSQHPGTRPIALAEPVNHYQYGPQGVHHIQQQQHLQQKRPFQHLAPAERPPLGYVGATHPASPMPATSPASMYPAHNAHQGTLSPHSTIVGAMSAGPHNHPHSPGSSHHQILHQKHFQHDCSLQDTVPAAPQHATVAHPPGRSPGIPCDSAPGIGATSPATEPPPLRRPSTKPEPGSSGSSATAAPTLPSVREITMSIGAMLPTNPHADYGRAASTHVTKPCNSSDSSARMDECVDSKRRPW